MNPLRLVSWNLTRRCNLACGHCYIDATRRLSQDDDELSTAEALGIIDQIAALAPEAMLILTGGEPLLRPDLDDLVAAAAGRGLMVVIGSNGVLLDSHRAAALREAGASGVGISLDSSEPGFHDRLRGRSGAWMQSRYAASAARKADLPLLVQTTLFAENRHDIAAIAALALDLGAVALNFFFLVCTGRGVTQTDLSAADYETTLDAILDLQAVHPNMIIRARCAPYVRRLLGVRHGEGREGFADWSSACLAGRSYLRITPTGDVTPCPYMPLAAGNLRTTPLAEIWNDAPALRRLREDKPGGKCGACDYRLSCGGCRARALATHGDLMAEDGKCTYEKPPAAAPEEPGQPPEGIAWHPDAAAMLTRIPGFVRARVRSRLEERARAEGLGEIGTTFMQAHRPPALAALRRPGQP